MKFDYSKTINEQLDIFNYYKNRYANYELSILKLQQENQELNKKIDILINNVAEYEDEYNKYKKIIYKAIYFVEDHIFQFDGDEDFEFLLKILKGKR